MPLSARPESPDSGRVAVHGERLVPIRERDLSRTLGPGTTVSFQTRAPVLTGGFPLPELIYLNGPGSFICRVENRINSTG